MRDTITELGGTMPEKLETPKKSIVTIENDMKRLI